MTGPVLSEECRRWDERYAAETSFFGTEPSPFLCSALATMRLVSPGSGQAPRALCLGEGEGRDAIYLARQGFSVTAVDGSFVALGKLTQRAHREGLSIETQRIDLSSYQPALGAYQLITSFYCHLPPSVRARIHRRAAAALAPGGHMVIEGFSTQQRDLGLSSGGPLHRNWLFTKPSLLGDFSRLRIVQLDERIAAIHYGRHCGEAAIVRLHAIAPDTETPATRSQTRMAQTRMVQARMVQARMAQTRTAQTRTASEGGLA